MEKKLLSILTVVLLTTKLVTAQEITSYRGAFAPAPVKMWTDDWTNWDPQTTVYPATDSTISTNIDVSITLSPAHVYLMNTLIHVRNGATLTILPGTILRGFSPSVAAGIVVQRGSKINAEGTACKPIVFTSNQPANSRAKGDWAGIILLGAAPNNQGNNINIEGISQSDPGAQYGGTVENDNSGTLKYVRIEFPGFVFSANNEINGLTFGSVGTGTTIDYVQVSFSNDDSFEWFGGGVTCKHLVAYRGLDDDWDTDFGYHGLVQYGLSVRDPLISDDPAVSTSEGFESDNYDPGTDESVVPKTSAKFYNITQIGGFRCSSNTTGTGVVPSANGFRRGARIRRNSDLKIVNSILMNNLDGVFFDGALVLGNIDQDSAVFRNNIIAGDFSTTWVSGVSTYNGRKSLAAQDGNTRTRLFNPTYQNDSLNTCSLLVNAWNFTNPDYRPNTAGAGAIAIDQSKLNSGADLFPFIEIDGTLFTANQSRDFLADVLENNSGASNGTITLTIPKLSGWTITVEGLTLTPGGPSVSGISNTSDVNGGTLNSNGNWNFRDDGNNIIATSKPGFVVERNGFYQLGFTATRKSTTASGTNQNLSVTVSGGGDTTPANNGAVTGFSAN